MMSHARRRLGYLALTLVVGLSFFQNCGPAFETIEDSEAMKSLRASRPFILINGGEEYSKTHDVVVSVTAETAESISILEGSHCAEATDASWGPVAAAIPLTLSPGNGVKTVSVRTRIGRALSQCQTATVFVDTTAPLVTLNEKPSDFINTRTARFVAAATDTDSGVHEYQCRLGQAEFKTCTMPYLPDGLENGPHVVEIQAVDRALNASTVVRHTFTVDSTEPLITINQGPGDFTNVRQANVAFAVTSAGSPITRVACRFNGADITPCNSPLSLAAINDGPQALEIAATNAAGTTATVRRTWTLDTVAPTIEFLAAPGAIEAVRTARVAFQALDAGSGLQEVLCSSQTPNGTLTTCAARDYSFANLPDASFASFAVRARDRAGNMANASRSWTIDATPPLIGGGLTFGCVGTCFFLSYYSNYAFSGIQSSSCTLIRNGARTPFVCNQMDGFGGTGFFDQGPGSYVVEMTATSRSGLTRTLNKAFTLSEINGASGVWANPVQACAFAQGRVYCTGRTRFYPYESAPNTTNSFMSFYGFADFGQIPGPFANYPAERLQIYNGGALCPDPYSCGARDSVEAASRLWFHPLFPEGSGTADVVRHQFPSTYFFPLQALGVRNGTVLAYYVVNSASYVGRPVLAMAGQTTDPMERVRGHIDRVFNSNGRYFAQGWACQRGVGRQMDIRIFAAGPPGQGTLIGSGTTGETNEPGVSEACESTGRAMRFTVELNAAQAAQFAGQPVFAEGLSRLGIIDSAILGNSGNVRL